jgi:hypothetical protein
VKVSLCFGIEASKNHYTPCGAINSESQPTKAAMFPRSHRFQAHFTVSSFRDRVRGLQWRLPKDRQYSLEFKSRTQHGPGGSPSD